MEFKIYQDGTGTVAGNPGGFLKWTEDWVYGSGSPDNRVTVRNGYFSVALGSVTAFGGSVNWNQDTLWLSVNIGNTSTAATFASAAGDGEMLPMRRLSTSVYALNAGQLGGLTASQFIQNVAPNTTQQTANINIVSGAATSVAAAEIQAVASATAPVLILKGGATPGSGADVLQLQNSSGTTLDAFDSSGNLTITSSSALKFGSTTVCTVSGCTPTGASGSYINNTATVQTNANIAIQSASDSSASLFIQNRASQSADLIRVVTSGNAPEFVLDTLGGARFYTGKVEFDQAVAIGDTPSAGQDLRIASMSASDIGLTVNAFTGQTGDLVQYNGLNSRSAIYTAAGTLAVTAGTNQTADGVTATQGNTSGTITNGLLVNRNGASGTTTNGVNITQTAGTLTNGLAFTGTIGTDITRGSGTLTIQGGGGVTLSTTNTSGASGSISIQGGNSSAGTAGNVGIDTGTTSTGTPAVNIGTANAKTIQLGSTSLSSGTQTIAIGNNNTSGGTTNVTIGTGTTAGGTTTVQASGALTLTGGASSTWSVGGSNQNLTLQTSGTGTLALQATGAGTIALGNNTQNSTINIGHTGATANTTSVHLADSSGATQTVSIGSTSASSTVAIQGGTGSSAITLSAGTSGSIKVGDANANTVSIGAVDVDAASTVNLNYALSGSAARTTLIGSNVGASNTSIYGGTNNINLNVNSSSAGVNIQTQTANSLTAFQIQNAANNNLFRFGTIDSNLIVNPGAESTFGTEWAAYGSNTTVSRTTTTAWNGDASVQVQVTPSTGSVGAKNNLGAALTANTSYTLSFYGRLKSGDPAFNDVVVAYSRDGTTGTEVACDTTTYPIQSLLSSGWARISCKFTTPVTAGNASAYVVVRQTAAAARTFYLDGMQLDQTNNIVNSYGAGSLRLDATIISPVAIQNTEDSMTEFSIQGAAGSSLFVADSLFNAIWIGGGTINPDSTPTLLVLDHKSTTGDPTPLIGGMYFNDATQRFRCYESIGWSDCMGVPRPNTRRWTYIIYNSGDGVFSSVGDGANISVGTGSSTNLAPTTSAPPVRELDTGTTSGNQASLSGSSFLYPTAALPTFQSYVLMTSTTNARMWTGLTSVSAATQAASATPTGDYAAFRYDTGAGDSTYKCVTSDGTTVNVINSGVTGDTNGHRFEVRILSNQVIFILDGNAVCATSTNMPRSSTLLTYVDTITTLTTAAKGIRLPWVYVESVF
ncbi:MAG TPA: hypothetical protein VLI05_01385 [Candidatus Saccharimonadia bacterium]|nr:hypothetical protein [Candidatus Saccharimonadia bacterium]